jgi:PAS domain S-box-containing protein
MSTQNPEERSTTYDESVLRGLLLNIPGMVYRGNPDWSVVIMSGCQELTGYAAEEISAMPGGWLALIHPDDKDTVAEQGGTLGREPMSIVQEYRIVRKEGETRWVEDRKSSFFHEGTFGGVDGVLLDITDRVRAQEALRAAQEAIIAQQSRAIEERSTPVLQVWDEVLILPLVGTVDTGRAQQILENLLESIVRTQASVVILDITGVPVIDTAVANHLLEAIGAAKTIGTEVIVTGVSPHNAQTLTKLRVDLSKIITKNSLQRGLAAALALTGHRVVLD